LRDLFFNYWNLTTDKVFELSSYYGVDPIIFGLLYVGTIPILWVSIGRIIRNLKNRKPILVPALISTLCMFGTYIYLFIAGQNIPLWVYVLAVGLMCFSVYKVRKKVKDGVEKAVTEEALGTDHD
jgi:hypothetical protein